MKKNFFPFGRNIYCNLEVKTKEFIFLGKCYKLNLKIVLQNYCIEIAFKFQVQNSTTHI